MATVQGLGQAVGWGSLLPPLAGPKGKPGAGACVSQGSPENHTCDRAPLSEPAHVVLGAEKSHICCPRAGGTGTLLVYGLRSHWCPPWRPRAQDQEVRCLSAGSDGQPSSGAERIHCSLAFCPAGPSVDWGCLPAPLSLSNQVLILPRNTVRHTPRNHVCPAIRASPGPVRSAYKLNHRRVH